MILAFCASLCGIITYKILTDHDDDETTTPHVEWTSTNVQKCDSFTNEDGTLQLNCVDYNDLAEDIATVTANQLPLPPEPTLDLTATPMTITAGQTTTLIWTSSNTTICHEGAHPLRTNGTRTMSPTVTTRYNVECSGPYGSVSTWVTVTVK